MKKINILLLMGLTYFSVPLACRAQQYVCPEGTCTCPQGCMPCGKSNYPCDNCDCIDCCPSKVIPLPFYTEPNIVYTFPKGIYFYCSSAEDGLQEHEGVHGCSSKALLMSRGEREEKKVTHTRKTVIYKFPSDMVFKCSQPPRLIQGTVPVNGLPSEYYICPGGTEGS